MSKEGRTYCVIRMVPGFNRAVFNSAKRDGVIQTDLTTVRKSLDGTLGILGWRGPMPPAVRGFEVWTGTHQEILAYLETNKTAWERPFQGVQPTRLARLATWIGGTTESTPRELPPGVLLDKGKGIPWWVWATIAGTIAATTYFLT